jgi:hypothetical protein
MNDFHIKSRNILWIGSTLVGHGSCMGVNPLVLNKEGEYS